VRLPGGDWRRLDELAVGERVEVSGGQGMWPEREVRLGYSPRRVVSGSLLPAVMSGTSVALQLAEGVSEEQVAPRLSLVRLPDFLDERTAVIAATILADGHVHRAKRENDLSGEDAELLVEALGLTVGPSAREKRIPEAILRSPEPVVRAFLRAYFDCDGHAGKQGVILSTASDALAETTQLLLLNYGILSRRRKLGDGCWHVTVTGASAAKFAKQIGFGLTRKQAALDAYVASHRWEKAERWDDEVVSLERGRGDVYDITVEETHRYAAAGFVNHNSYWHSRIMTEKALRPAEIIDYADANAGVLATAPGQLNPYKLGVELFRHIEDRWNKGRFGKEWNECDDMAVKREWDRRLGIGRQKVFEVRKLYNDVTFIDEFFTMEFCIEQKFYAFNFSERSGNWEIESREFKKVKDKLLFRLTNHGQPFIYVVDGNLENRGELLLRHQHEGVDLKLDHARDTLVALNRVWKRPVNLLTKIDAKGKMLRFDGRDHSEKSAEFPEKM
jgi:stage V sporulation protein R